MATKVPYKVVSTHNTELDSKLGSGLPAGSLVLIEGGSGAGKSVLTQQILWGALQDGYHAVLFTSENGVKSLVSQMDSIDLDILDYLLLTKLRVVPMALSRLNEQAPRMLLNNVHRYHHADIVAIDSLTAALTNTTDQAEILLFFEECKKLTAAGKTVIITLHAKAVEGELVNTLRSLCDAHLLLRSEQDGQRIIKLLEVVKVRGAASATGAIVGFDVEPGWGMRLIPISKARG